MPVPSYDRFIEPVLRFLATREDPVPAKDVHRAAADALDLSAEDRAELVPSGVQAVYKNRAGWAHDRLKRAGLSASPRRGHWQLTEAGREYVARHAAPLPDAEIERIATEYVDIRLRPLADGVVSESAAAISAPLQDSATVSPDDRLEQALGELRQSVAAELLDLLSRVDPTYFETIVLDLLHRMGYGTSRADLLRVGRSGDGGIDGIIALDRLGLEKVYVQAKRQQASVGRPEVQSFYGALAGRRASKGVFITTAAFTQQAFEYAASLAGVVLVDGVRLASLMIEHEVGVSSRAVRVPKVDSDYFEE